MAGRSHAAVVPRAVLLLGICLHAAATAAAYRISLSDASVTSTIADGDATTDTLTFPQLLHETLLLTPETHITVDFTLTDALSGQPVAPQQVTSSLLNRLTSYGIAALQCVPLLRGVRRLHPTNVQICWQPPRATCWTHRFYRCLRHPRTPLAAYWRLKD